VDANYMLACGIVWRKTADPDAGWELVEALASPDPELLAKKGEPRERILRANNIFNAYRDADSSVSIR
jgi:hypothetical protein